jgi:hypothetical protein
VRKDSPKTGALYGSLKAARYSDESASETPCFISELLALAPVNSAAKAVSAVIEPLAASQKVFELTLINQMKAAAIITQLEADILEQLNKQRNKAAHPSGHVVTAEEARFVFSEAIQKFLSQPIRQTSVLVASIIPKISRANFFPTTMMPDMNAVVQ